MRTFETTHPWINFRFDLSKAGPTLWMKLGEAASKCDHIAGVPLQIRTAELLHRLCLAKGAQATTAIEGNPLTVQEVQQHLAGQLKLPLSLEYHGKEINNVVTAFAEIEREVREGSTEITVARLCRLNKLVLFGLPLDSSVRPGELRRHSVVVGNAYQGAPAEDCEFLLEKLCAWLSGRDFVPPEGYVKVYGIIKAVVSHLYLAWIHPFGDGNGRTARLVEFHILLSSGIPTPAAHLLSNHYNLTRAEYYRQLDYASKSGGDILPFIEYAVTGFVEGLKEQLEFIRNQQWDVTWESYVHQVFRDKQSPAQIRQRWLALDLGDQDAPVSYAQIRELTPRVAKAYHNKTAKTIQRDLGALEKMGIVERGSDGVRAKREIILAFLPWKSDGPEN